MLHTAAALVLFGFLSAVGAPQKSESTKPTHAIRGVVKAIGSSYVVITVGSGRKARDMTFALTASTFIEGEPTIGATVSIRYWLDHRLLTATAMATPTAAERRAEAPRVR